jgi:hypothetical protein
LETIKQADLYTKRANRARLADMGISFWRPGSLPALFIAIPTFIGDDRRREARFGHHMVITVKEFTGSPVSHCPTSMQQNQLVVQQ